MSGRRDTQGTELSQVKSALAKDKQVIAAAAELGLPVNVYIEQVLFKMSSARTTPAEEDPPTPQPHVPLPLPEPRGSIGHKSQSAFSIPKLKPVTLASAPGPNPRRFRVDAKLVRTVTGRIRALRARKP